MRLAELLQRRDQSYTDVAKLAGVSPQTISRIAAGKRRPSVELAMKIGRATHSRVAVVRSEFRFTPNARRRVRSLTQRSDA